MARRKSPKIKIVNKIKKGDVLEVQVSQKYPSSTGLGLFPDSEEFIRKEPAIYLNKMTAYYNGKEVGSLDMSSAISANPRISFPLKVDKPGTLKVVFTSNEGEEFESTKEIEF
ncbi:MAG: thiosulfate oxidation carrier complex protein SoxZ [Nitrospinota bacterium]|nr:thiosulfate oxidation carrier complex protein SoxZ [Nitrospinota bacterium]